MKTVKIAFVLITALLITACQPAETPNPVEDIGEGNETENIVGQQATQEDMFDNATTTEQNVSQIERVTLNGSIQYQINATEGDIVRVPLTAVDPDGGDITYTYSEPLNENGIWETQIGDEGQHIVEVTASDGIDNTTVQVQINLARANRPPVIDCPDEFRFQEGDLVNLDCNIYDPDDEQVSVSYSGWSTSRTKRTTFGDAGTHTVQIRASDGQNAVTEEVQVIIEPVNRPPVIEGETDVTVQETSTAAFNLNITDPDGDSVDVRYTRPLNEDGVWQTDFGDAGTYSAAVIASDGQDETRQTLTINVERRNRAPVIRPIDTITVREGETVELQPEVYDPDGDSVSISYSGWMDSATKEVPFGAAYPEGCEEKGCTARYTVFITADDGDLTTQEEVTIEVQDVNRPPQFITE